MSYEFEFTTGKSVFTDDDRRKAAEQIRRVADIWLILLNRHEQDHESTSPLGQELLSHVSPNFVAKADNYQTTMSWTELRSAWLKDTIENPKMNLRLERLSTYVDEDKGKALTYQEQTCLGLSNPVEMRMFSEIRFELQNEKWMVTKFHVMRGHVGLAGFV